MGVPCTQSQTGLLATPSGSLSTEFWQLVEDAASYLDPARLMPF